MRFRSQKYRSGPMHSGEMMEALGLRAGAHLPREGLPPRLIQGVRVWVAPFQDMGPLDQRHHSSTHRVMCECPDCGTRRGGRPSRGR